MSITTNANRIRVESAAKNGTLGAQGTLNANQIKFDTAITTNNGNLVASPVFRRRHVIIRRGLSNEEQSVITSVDVDGLTCTVQDDWDEAPTSGDSYDVGYVLDDVQTIVGCQYETDSLQWTIPAKRLVVGDGTNFAYLGIGQGRILRIADRGPTEAGFVIANAGRFDIGTIRNDRAQNGGTLVFTHNSSDETVMNFLSGAIGRLYDFTFINPQRHAGVTGLTVAVNAAADVKWARVKTYAMTTPFRNKFRRFKLHRDINYTSDDQFVLTVTDIKNSAMWTGWCKSEYDRTLYNEIMSDPDAAQVRLLLEGEVSD